MRRTGQVVAITLVAAALCADRAVAAAPASAAPISQAARQFADRLASGFRQNLAQVQIHHQFRREGVAAVAPSYSPIPEAETPSHPAELSAFQFRLPPPMA